MNSFLFWLTLNIGLVSIMWVSYTLNAFKVFGVLGHLGYPTQGQLDDWATRAKKAHLNAVENLVLFLPLVLIAFILLYPNQQADYWSTLTEICEIYFFARLIHFISYTLKVPYIRTLSFLGGFALQIYLIILINQITSH